MSIMHEKFTHSEKIHKTGRGQYIGDIVYGANDGIVTTFAVISGAAGASLSAQPIIILGLASLIADGISMGLSNYLAITSKLDFQKQERLREIFEIENFPEKERDEVREILAKWKVPESKIDDMVDILTANKDSWVDLMMREELGIFEDKVESPVRHGIITSISFFIAGSLPLLPYIFGIKVGSPFAFSLMTTAISLFVVGGARTIVTGSNWLKSAIQMLIVGGLAAFAAYLVGGIVKNIFGIVV